MSYWAVVKSLKPWTIRRSYCWREAGGLVVEYFAGGPKTAFGVVQLATMERPLVGGVEGCHFEGLAVFSLRGPTLEEVGPDVCAF